MPTTYEIDPKGRFVLARYVGHITREDIRTMFAAYQSDPEFRLDLPHIVDLRTADTTDVDNEGMRLALYMFQSVYTKAAERMIAAIVVSDDLFYGMARMYQSLSEMSEFSTVRLFENMDDAVEWVVDIRAKLEA